MADYGFAVYKNGKLWASPDYTPLVLVQLIDQLNMIPGSQYTVQTNVPNGRQNVVFGRTTQANVAVSFYTQDGDAGYQKIVINFVKASNGIPTVGIRFYIFSNFVAWTPGWGFFLYRNGAMVYSGNCLPLQMKYMPVNSPNPAIPCGTQAGYADAVSNAIPGQSNATLTVLMLWAGSPDGIFATPYQEIERVGNTPVVLPVPSKGCLYIETTLYDRYHKFSLGY